MLDTPLGAGTACGLACACACIGCCCCGGRCCPGLCCRPCCCWGGAGAPYAEPLPRIFRRLLNDPAPRWSSALPPPPPEPDDVGGGMLPSGISTGPGNSARAAGEALSTSKGCKSHDYHF